MKIVFAEHIRRHLEEDAQSGSKFAPGRLEIVMDLVARALMEDRHEAHPYVLAPDRVVLLELDESAEAFGHDALFNDPLAHGIWDRQFGAVSETLKALLEEQAEEGGSKAMRVPADTEGYQWELREFADFPVLVNLRQSPLPTRTATAICSPDDSSGWFVKTLFPGTPAPRISEENQAFWRTHVFLEGPR